MHRKLCALIALTLLGSTGCYRFTVKDSSVDKGAEHSKEWHPFIIYGLVPIGENPIEAGEKCEGGLASVQKEISFLNGLASWFTFSLFNPVTVRYTCAGGGKSQVSQKNSNSAGQAL